MVLSNWKILEAFLKLRFYLQNCRWGGSEPQGFVNSELGRVLLSPAGLRGQGKD